MFTTSPTMNTNPQLLWPRSLIYIDDPRDHIIPADLLRLEIGENLIVLHVDTWQCIFYNALQCQQGLFFGLFQNSPQFLIEDPTAFVNRQLYCHLGSLYRLFAEVPLHLINLPKNTIILLMNEQTSQRNLDEIPNVEKDQLEQPQSSSSCTLDNQPQPHQKALDKYLAYVKMTKENKRRLAIMRWMKKVLRVVVGILTFVPEIFFSYQSRFNSAFTNLETYAMLSGSRLSEAVETSFQFRIPLMVMFCFENSEPDRATISALLEQYQIGHFLNQSFLVTGLFDTDSDYKGYFQKFSKDTPGLYFFRADITEQLDNYRTLPLHEVQKLDAQEVIEKLKKVRNEYYTLGQTDLEVRGVLATGQIID